ncbi:MAG: hypothetical protein ACRD0C_24675, partial [Acidimicrobiia bacterium]
MRTVQRGTTGDRRRVRTASAVLAGLALTSGAACGSRLDTRALEASNGAFKRVVDTSEAPAAAGQSQLMFGDSAAAVSPASGSTPVAASPGVVSGSSAAGPLTGSAPT